MDDGSGAQEEKGLEKGMGREVEDPCGKGSHSHGGEHIAELTHGRISQDLLDIVLVSPMVAENIAVATPIPATTMSAEGVRI